MSKKKGKFDLTQLVHADMIKDGQTFFFVSDPKQTFKVARQPNAEYKIIAGGEVTTVHAFATKCLGQEPPDHASKWFRDEKGSTLYDFWQLAEENRKAA